MQLGPPGLARRLRVEARSVARGTVEPGHGTRSRRSPEACAAIRRRLLESGCDGRYRRRRHHSSAAVRLRITTSVGKSALAIVLNALFLINPLVRLRLRCVACVELCGRYVGTTTNNKQEHSIVRPGVKPVLSNSCCFFFPILICFYTQESYTIEGIQDKSYLLPGTKKKFVYCVRKSCLYLNKWGVNSFWVFKA